MKKFLPILLVLVLFTNAQAGNLARRFPNNTAIEVITPTSGDADYLRQDGTTTPTADIGFGDYNITGVGTLSLKEQADANADVAGYGQIWVNTATPNELWWTDDAGADTQLGTGGGSGDSVSIDSVAVVDPDFVSTGDIDFVDTANTVTANINTGKVQDAEIDYTAVTLNDFTFDVGSVSKTEYGYLDLVTSAIQTQIDTKGAHAGQVWTGVHDFGGASSVEVENAAGDIVLAELGAIGVDTAQKQFVVYDGVEKVIPLRHIAQGSLGTGDWDTDPDVKIIELDSDVYPDGIIITAWDITCNEADPATELNANLKYCDDAGTGAFPGANAVLIDVLDTTTGDSSEATMSNSDLGSGTIPTGKTLYVLINADLVSDTTLFFVKIHFYIPES